MRAYLMVNLLILACAWLVPGVLVGQQAERRNRSTQVICLENGHLIFGTATVEGQNTIVLTGASRLVMPNSKVVFVCDSLGEAYWQKAARTRASDVEGQVELFQWCLKHKLFREAQNQIDIIQFMDIAATRLEFLNRQLIVGSDPNTKPTPNRADTIPTQIAETPRSPSTTDWSGQAAANSFRPLPAISEPNEIRFSNLPAQAVPDQQVQQVDFEQPISKDPALAENTAPESLEPPKPYEPSIPELERLSSTLPKPAVALFKRKIEPLFVRSCYAAGCHHSDDSIMPLRRMGHAQVIPRRLSQRNMHSIIRFADPNQPMSSPLLLAAVQPHGGAEKPVIPLDSQQYINLRDWLILVSNNPTGLHPVIPPGLANTIRPPHSARPQAQDLVPDPGPPPFDHPARENPAPENSSQPTSSGQAPDLSQLTGSAANTGIKPERSADNTDRETGRSNDPFDPEEFNRKFARPDKSK